MSKNKNTIASTENAPASPEPVADVTPTPPPKEKKPRAKRAPMTDEQKQDFRKRVLSGKEQKGTLNEKELNELKNLKKIKRPKTPKTPKSPKTPKTPKTPKSADSKAEK